MSLSRSPQYNLYFLSLLFVFFVSSFWVSEHGEEYEVATVFFPFPFYGACFITLFLGSLIFLTKGNNMKMFSFSRLGLCLLLMTFFLPLLTCLYTPSGINLTLKWVFIQALIMLLGGQYFLVGRGSKVRRFVTISKVVASFGLCAFIFALTLYFKGEVDFFFTQIVHFPGYPRLYGWFGNPNRFGAAMATSFFAAQYLFNVSTKKRQYLWGVAAVVLLVGIFLSGSRTALVATLMAIVSLHAFDLCSKSKNGLQWLFRIFLIFIVAIGLLTGLFFSVGEDHFIRLFKLSELDFTASGRLYIWRDGLILFLQSSWNELLFGHGLGFFQKNVGASAHSFYVKHLVESGVIYIILVVSLNMFLLLRAASKRTKTLSNNSLHSLGFSIKMLVFLFINSFATQSIMYPRFEFVIYSFIFAFLLSGLEESKVSDSRLHHA